jgi:putative FmdB family regulatory protein
MPSYDYRCKNCETRFSLFYKTYHDYDSATRLCPNCASAELSRVIDRVAIQKPTRDFTKMSSGEMLSVFESGDSRQVGEMFQQVGGTSPELGLPYHEATQKLLSGEKMEKVEQDLRTHENAVKSEPPSTI